MTIDQRGRSAAGRRSSGRRLIGSAAGIPSGVPTGIASGISTRVPAGVSAGIPSGVGARVAGSGRRPSHVVAGELGQGLHAHQSVHRQSVAGLEILYSCLSGLAVVAGDISGVQVAVLAQKLLHALDRVAALAQHQAVGPGAGAV